jgi:hypothetical protein
MGRARRLVGCLACLIVVCACSTQTKDPVVGPAPEGPAPELCGTVCSRWKAMGCAEGEKVCDKYAEPSTVCQTWITCEQWCEGVETAQSQPLNLQCLATAAASTCQALEDACTY